MKSDIILPDGVTWEEIENLIKGNKYKSKLNKIKSSTLKFALEDDHKPMLIKALVKVLMIMDPKNATEEYAEKMIGSLRKVAHKILEQKNEEV